MKRTYLNRNAIEDQHKLNTGEPSRYSPGTSELTTAELLLDAQLPDPECTRRFNGCIGIKKIAFLLLGLVYATLLFPSTYYVATTGADLNSGTSLDDPFLSIVTAISKVKAGDTIWVRGGTYAHAATIYLTGSGTQTDTIFLLAYADEKPLLDFSGTEFGKRGMTLSGSYWKIKGFEMVYAGDNALNISGGNNTIEFCSFHDNKDSGLQMGGGAHDNNVINCDSYFNADPSDYGDADGFAAKLDVGTNNYFYGCRSWYNVDDGWDGYMRGNDDVSTTLENCWTWCNGYFKDGTDGGASANGNGFKVGGSDDKTLQHNFTLINCLAFYNKAKGFDQNNNKGSMFFYNCTGFGNKGYDYSIPATLASGKTAEIKNCVLYNGTKNIASFVIQSSNSWDSNFTIDQDDFISVDTTGISGARKSDGSLPETGFMHLSDSSDLVNAGINLGYPYIGSAPDLGAFETSVTVGIKQFSNASSLKVYQNSKNMITVQFYQEKDGDALVALYDLRGNIVYQKQFKELEKGEQQTLIPVSLSQGIYLFYAGCGQNYYSKKIPIK